MSILIKFISMDRGSLLPNDTAIKWMIEYSKIVDDELFVQIIDMCHSLEKIFIFDFQVLPFSNCLLFPLQYALCSRMPKPPEYNGDKELFDKMSETIVLLFGMHRNEILVVIVEKINLPNYVEAMVLFIYSIGATSGVCDENEEKAFLSVIIESMLRLNQTFSWKNIANNIRSLAKCTFPNFCWINRHFFDNCFVFLFSLSSNFFVFLML